MSDLLALEAEQEVLGALAWHGREALPVVRDHVSGAEDFSPANRAGYRVLEAMAEQGAPFSVETARAIAFTLGESHFAEEVGEWFDTALAGAIGALGSVAYYAQLVAEMAQRRLLLLTAQQLATAAADRTIPIAHSMAELVAKATPRIVALRAEDATRDYLFETLASLEERAKHLGQTPGIPSRLDGLDSLTDGWEKSRLIVIAARPKCGKTALGVWCAQAAVEDDVPVMFFTAEQPTKQLQFRRLAVKGKIDLREATSTQWGWEHHGKIVGELANQMRKEPLVFDQAARTPGQIRLSLQRQIARDFRPKLLVVDYLTKFRPDGRFDRHDLAVGAISGAMAEIAKEFDIPILLLAQLNRDSVKDGKPRRPTMTDLRDSGLIEQDADQVLLLWPGAVEEGELMRDRAPGMEGLEIVVDANRHGPTGTVRVDWHKPTGCFSEPNRFQSRRDVA